MSNSDPFDSTVASRDSTPVTAIICGTDKAENTRSPEIGMHLARAGIQPSAFAQLPVLKVHMDDVELGTLCHDLSQCSLHENCQIVITSQVLVPKIGKETSIGQQFIRLGQSIMLGGVGEETYRLLDGEWSSIVHMIPPQRERGLAPVLNDYENLLQGSKGLPTRLFVLGASGGISHSLFEAFKGRNPEARAGYYPCYSTFVNEETIPLLIHLLEAARSGTTELVFVVRSGQVLRALVELLERQMVESAAALYPPGRLLLWGASSHNALDEVRLPSWLHSCENR